MMSGCSDFFYAIKIALLISIEQHEKEGKKKVSQKN
jgi:hypothetical protein